MSAIELVKPDALYGSFPERLDNRPNWLQRGELQILRRLKSHQYRRFGRFRTRLARIREHANRLSVLNNTEMDAKTLILRSNIQSDGLTQSLCEKAFAFVTVLAKRELGFNLYDEQIFAGWIMTHGLLAEMQTGEGKTLTASLPVCVAALAGVPVHVITTNDYLVERDAAGLRKLYEALSLSVATINQGMTPDERRVAYTADIVYVSNKQIVFDYLKDLQNIGVYPSSLRGKLRSPLGSHASLISPVMRGLCFAVVDEADSVLIDDAQTPLILSQSVPSTESASGCGVALGLARCLNENDDFVVEYKDRRLNLTESGIDRLTEMAQALSGKWRNPRYRKELVCQALTALFLFKRDHHYLVRDGKIGLIDENTGRVMPERTLSLGLHHMVEVKEGCKISNKSETLARLSYQQFFRRYFKLTGMTGTATEVSGELRSVYGLPVVRVPTHRRCQRKTTGVTVFADQQQKLRVLLTRVTALRKNGRPVLIGTRSVLESEAVSKVLHQGSIPHRVLNASQNVDEADIIAEAGRMARVTVSTNMAGRGTDIPLESGVAEAGGLHVICTHANDARRIDRQLYGRCARQGDPGSYEALLSLDDEFFKVFYPRGSKSVLKRMVSSRTLLRNSICWLLTRFPQWMRERKSRQLRAAVLHQESRFFDLLSFAGKNE